MHSFLFTELILHAPSLQEKSEKVICCSALKQHRKDSSCKLHTITLCKSHFAAMVVPSSRRFCKLPKHVMYFSVSYIH